MSATRLERRVSWNEAQDKWQRGLDAWEGRIRSWDDAVREAGRAHPMGRHGCCHDETCWLCAERRWRNERRRVRR